MTGQIVQFLGSLIAIIAVSYICGRVFPQRPALTVDQINKSLERLFPDHQSSQIMISGDKQCALIRVQPNHLIVARSMGRDIACREISEVIYVDHGHGSLNLKLPDFTMPNLCLKLNPAEHIMALQWLDGLPRAEKKKSYAR